MFYNPATSARCGVRERPPAVPVGPGLLRSTLARGGPGAGAGPSPVASDDGWRRVPGADEVREHYMDSKFGGEGADMSESVMG